MQYDGPKSIEWMKQNIRGFEQMYNESLERKQDEAEYKRGNTQPRRFHK